MIASGDYVAVGRLVQSLARETENLIKLCQQIAIYSQGGISYPDQALLLTPAERDVALELLQKKLETEEVRFAASIGAKVKEIVR